MAETTLIVEKTEIVAQIVGAQGPRGLTGATGATGAAGAAGTKGDKGDTGDTGPAGTTSWNGLADKPSTFTPSSHTHPQSEITDLVSALAGKEASGTAASAVSTHAAISDGTAHSMSGISGLVSALAGKAASSHAHAVADLSDATANGRSLISAANYAAMRGLLGLATTDSPTFAGLKVGTTTKKIEIYNLDTDASNYERGFLRWSSNVLEIGAEAAGTGTARNLRLYGNVGIGGAPTDTLHLAANTNQSITVSSGTSNKSFFGSYDDYCMFGVNRNPTTNQWATTSKAAASFYLQSASGSSRIAFLTSNQNGVIETERLTIDGSGVVNIGGSSNYASFAANGSLSFVGTAKVTGNMEFGTTAAGLILKSPDGTRYKATIANGGTWTISAA